MLPAVEFYAKNKGKDKALEVFFWELERLAACMFALSYDVNKRIERYAKLLNTFFTTFTPSCLCSIKHQKLDVKRRRDSWPCPPQKLSEKAKPTFRHFSPQNIHSRKSSFPPTTKRTRGRPSPLTLPMPQRKPSLPRQQPRPSLPASRSKTHRQHDKLPAPPASPKLQHTPPACACPP